MKKTLVLLLALLMLAGCGQPEVTETVPPVEIPVVQTEATVETTETPTMPPVTEPEPTLPPVPESDETSGRRDGNS